MFEFLQSISDFVQQGIYTLLQEWAVYFTTTLLIWYLKAKLMALEFAWTVAQGILEGFQITSRLSQAFGLLPSSAASIVNFFRFPEAVNLILSGAATRWVIKIVPGL